MELKKPGLCLLVALGGLNAMADSLSDPCAGNSALLTLTNRPSATNSACAVPYKELLLQLGYQYQELTQGTGNLQNFPQAILRLGLPFRNEVSFIVPNDIRQTGSPPSGNTATSLGFKHEIGYTKSWIGALEGILTLPDGSNAFGSAKTGFSLNGLLGYAINSSFSLAFNIGGSTETTPPTSGGQRYNSFNPNAVLTYSLNSRTNLYGEVYAQTQTGPDQGFGANADAGIIFLATKNIALDLEYYQRLSGQLGGFEHFVGVGISFLH